MARGRKIRYAVVGLGHFAQTAVLPAFKNAKNAELVGLISGDEMKLAELSERYNVEFTGTYDDFATLLSVGDVDAVYVVLPNSLHCEFAVQAMQAGVSVLCEKPMALTVVDCEKMIAASDESGAKLMIGYRLHFEKTNLSAVEIVKSGRIGDPRMFSSVFAMQVNEGNIRTEAELGGGPLYDIGTYCINAARSLFQAEPLEVTALFSSKPDDPRFFDVEAQVGAVMRFPGERLATFSVSFASTHTSRYEVLGSDGRLVLEPAYGHASGLKYQLTEGEKTTRRSFKKRDQVAAEIIYFSDCILRDRRPEPSGHEGLLDVRVIEALMESSREGRAVQLAPASRNARPGMHQEKEVPAHGEPPLVRVEPPAEHG